MIGLFYFVIAVLASPFKSKMRLEAENAVLRHQLIVLKRRLRGRARLTNNDRWFLVQLYRWFPSILQVVTIVRPEAHRTGFTLAEWLCRTADRVDPTRVCRPHHCLWRGAPAPDSAIVCLLLQRDQNSPVIGQGHADLSPGSADRCH